MSLIGLEGIADGKTDNRLLSESPSGVYKSSDRSGMGRIFQSRKTLRCAGAVSRNGQREQCGGRI